jgi:nitrogen-specific signal transduction histidine kinase
MQNLAHEMKSPLTGMIGTAKIIKDWLLRNRIQLSTESYPA